MVQFILIKSKSINSVREPYLLRPPANHQRVNRVPPGGTIHITFVARLHEIVSNVGCGEGSLFHDNRSWGNHPEHWDPVMV